MAEIPLRDLDAALLWQLELPSGRSFRTDAPSVQEAQGVMFLCPKCYQTNNGPIGTHSVICWFVGIPLTIDPKPGRWRPQGSSIDDLTFIGPGAASVLLTGDGCGWHGFVRNGKATV